MKSSTFFVYLLRCADQSLYTGYTVHLEKRLEAHRRGIASKYTRSRRPIELAAFWTVSSRSTALRLEAAIKRLRRAQKEALLAHSEDLQALQAVLGKEILEKETKTVSQ